MQKFIELFEKIDQTQSTNEKVDHIKNYFSSCEDADSAWALFFLCGHRLKRLISSKMLLDFAIPYINYPRWLVEESKASVGDTAETIALLLPRKNTQKNDSYSLSEWMAKIILPLESLNLKEKEKKVIELWKSLNTKEIFIVNKILTGSFRVGVSKSLTVRGLAEATGISSEILFQGLMGDFDPSEEFFRNLKDPTHNDKLLNPYPFYLASPYEDDINALGNTSDWIIEWKWDGIRGQAVIGEETSALWSRGNELVSDQFPELIEAFKTISPGTILDGEILAYENKHPLPFGDLQKRLNRKKVQKSHIENTPIVFVVYDILKYNHQDLRQLPLSERREILQNIHFSNPKIFVSELIEGLDWQQILDLRTQSREKGVEGLMFKKKSSIYGVGRQKGSWWKYKVDPMTIDAVLIYASAGSGRRANLFTDYTFGIWKDDELIPIAKAYSGLDQKEIAELDKWIRRNTEEKFGPTRKVKAQNVFEIGFEGLQESKRHKSGIALRFPRILRWRKDKPVNECDTLESVKATYLHEEK